VVGLLSALGYPVATSGVSIYIGQFELLIAAACAGLNSLISLTAIGSFYVYLRHNASWRYTLILVLAIFPIAVFANFIRVLMLVLLTYYGGEAVAQGFLHEFAGLFMFVVAVLMIFLIDRIVGALLYRFGSRARAV
jgi:exosortase